MLKPIICFGQQPNGFFPKRFFVSKINTARKLQKEIGGKIVLFYHDSDADYRETITVMIDRNKAVDLSAEALAKAEARLNFLQPNKVQKKFSPLYAKKISPGWKQKTLKQLPRFVDRPLIDVFASIDETLSVADFCLEMYQKMGLLDGIDIARSGDKSFRGKAGDLDTGYFADVKYRGETVRAEMFEGKLRLHEGGDKYIILPGQKIEKWQKSPGRDQRFGWMQSAIHCTHYISGASENEYLDKSQFPEVTFVEREKIDNPNFVWLGD